MPAVLEKLVRPIIVVDTRPRVVSRFPSTAAEDEEKLQEIIGNSGKFVALNHSLSYELSKKFKDEKEKKRKFDVIKVKNRDDPNQFVEVEAITKLWTNPNAKVK